MPTLPRPNRRVAVVIEASNAYARGLLAGIHRHVREHEPWTVFLPEHGRGTPPLEALSKWGGDGVIARIETEATAKAVAKLRRKLGIPVIDVSAARLVADLPYVETDDTAIAALAADHFLERDFRHFAFLGDDRFQWSDNRCRGFVEAVAANGYRVAVFSSRGRRTMAPADDDAAVEAWLAGLPKPVALLACYDIRGRQAIDACRRTGIAVPDEVAVLGVDDDDVLCGLASPPLSSVIPDAIGAGRRAAELLEQLMRGESLERSEWLLPPLGIAVRQSTEVLAIDEPVHETGGPHAARGDRPGAVSPRRAAAAGDGIAAGHDRHAGRLPAHGIHDRGVHETTRHAPEPLAAAETMTVATTARRAVPRGSGAWRWGGSGRRACRAGRSPDCSGSPVRSCRPYPPAACPRSSRGSPD